MVDLKKEGEQDRIWQKRINKYKNKKNEKKGTTFCPEKKTRVYNWKREQYITGQKHTGKSRGQNNVIFLHVVLLLFTSSAVPLNSP